ncbi:hypothetical protein ACIQUF_18880 [Pseudomonas sp. NPDC090233]|uniref:hypothetical protein n=1 Tax=Pseudomonas sp. NPDC090233 TaxID=3364479 RepID=UPI00383AE351
MVDVLDSSTGKVSEGKMPFFVVSPMKFAVMTFFVMGFYWLYCFYCSWKQHREATGEEISPFWRSFFAIFFIYPLLKRADDRIRDSGLTYHWNILGLTLGYYGLCVVGIVISVVLADQLWPAYIAGFVFQLALLLILVPMQKGINFSAGDEAGVGNSRFTGANWVWISLCTAFRMMQFVALVELSSMM